MALEKQNTIRILKSTPTKPQKKSSIYVICGFLGGIVLSCGLFGFFYYSQDSEKSNLHPSDHQQTESETNTHTPQATEQSEMKEDDLDYSNQINEQEMSTLFKHPVNPTVNLNSHVQHTSPFAQLNPEPQFVTKDVIVIEKNEKKNQPTPTKPKPLAQGVVKPALLDQLDKEIELVQPQAQTILAPSTPAHSH